MLGDIKQNRQTDRQHFLIWATYFEYNLTSCTINVGQC